MWGERPQIRDVECKIGFHRAVNIRKVNLNEKENEI